MIDVIEVQDQIGHVVGLVDVTLGQVRCLRCLPACRLAVPPDIGSAGGLGDATTALVAHLASVHGELADRGREADDREAAHAALWASAYSRLRRSKPTS